MTIHDRRPHRVGHGQPERRGRGREDCASGETKTLNAEMLLVAVGRGPGDRRAEPRGTKVQLDRGYVKVNDRMETDEPGVYAIGDVVSVDGQPHPQLAHVASHEGIGVVERLAGKATEPVNYDRVPSATYCQPEMAGVGLTEAEAKRRGYDVKVGKFAVRQPGQAAHHRPRRGLREGRRRSEVRRDPGRPHRSARTPPT